MILAAKAASASGEAFPYRWVGVSVTGQLATSDSTTASSWTTRTSSFGSDNIFGVESNGTSLYVAVGDVGKLATSPDGITWTQRTSSFGTTTIYGVAFGNGVWTAVGQSGKIATSTDGITWTQRTSGTANDLVAVGYGNSLFVAGGLSTMVTAPDPTSTWTSRTSTLTGLRQNGIHYFKANSIWVAGQDGGTTGCLASSTDGTTWTARSCPFTAAAGAYSYSPFTSNTSAVVFGNQTAVTPTCDFASSTNGTTWTDRTPADTSEQVYGAASDSTGFMIMAGSKIQSTTDGTTWTDRGAVPFTYFLAVCHSSGVPAIR